MEHFRTVEVGLVAALSLALTPAATFASPSQADASSEDTSITAPSNPPVSEEDRQTADAQQAEENARAARPDPQPPTSAAPSAPSTQTPPLVTTQPDGSIGNDYPDGSDPRYPWRANIATWGQEDQVRPYLDSLGVNSSNLDFFIGTHQHSDHIG